MRKFITEEYLRVLYKKEPFNTYNLNPSQRLTPGAKEYLSDKRIELIYDASEVSNKNEEKKTITKDKQEENTKQEEPIKEINIPNYKKKLCAKLKAIETQCLILSRETLKEDIILSQNIVDLAKKISNIRKYISGKQGLETIEYRACSGITLHEFSCDLEDCFDISEFHMQLEKSNTILKMELIRCSLREIRIEIIDAYESQKETLESKVEDNINCIINLLSQLICSSVGGRECQRKI